VTFSLFCFCFGEESDRRGRSDKALPTLNTVHFLLFAMKQPPRDHQTPKERKNERANRNLRGAVGIRAEPYVVRAGRGAVHARAVMVRAVVDRHRKRCAAAAGVAKPQQQETVSSLLDVAVPIEPREPMHVEQSTNAAAI
jgi:hypothetical protein